MCMKQELSVWSRCENVLNASGLSCQSFGSVSYNKACYDLKFHRQQLRWIATIYVVLIWFQWLSFSMLVVSNLNLRILTKERAYNSLCRLDPIFLKHVKSGDDVVIPAFMFVHCADALPFTNAYFGEHSSPGVNLTSFRCYGSESRLTSCSYSTTSCGVSQVTGVRCQGKTVAGKKNGLQLLPYQYHTL